MCWFVIRDTENHEEDAYSEHEQNHDEDEEDAHVQNLHFFQIVLVCEFTVNFS